jgi:hypothetical protein
MSAKEFLAPFSGRFRRPPTFPRCRIQLHLLLKWMHLSITFHLEALDQQHLKATKSTSEMRIMTMVPRLDMWFSFSRVKCSSESRSGWRCGLP